MLWVHFLEDAFFDHALFFVEPIEVFVEVVFVEGFESEDVTGGVGVGEADGGEARALVDNAGDDLPEGEFSGAGGAESGGDAELFSEVVDEPGGTDGRALLEGDVFGERAEGGEVACDTMVDFALSAGSNYLLKDVASCAKTSIPDGYI